MRSESYQPIRERNDSVCPIRGIRSDGVFKTQISMYEVHHSNNIYKSFDFAAELNIGTILFEIYLEMFCDHLFTDVGREICTMEYK